MKPFGPHRITFRQRLLGGFIGTTSLCLGIWLLLTYRWIEVRAEEEVESRLELAAEKVAHLHRSGAEGRRQRFGTLALEPRFRALAEIGDQATLRFAATEIRAGLASAAFGFLGAEGNVLAWDGIDAPRVTEALRMQAAAAGGGTEQQNLVLDDAVVEFTVVPLAARGELLGRIAVGTAVGQSILEDYAVAARGRVEMRSGARVLAAGGPPLDAMAEPRPIRVGLGPDLELTVFLDVDEVLAPLRDTLSMMGLAGALVVALGSFMVSAVSRRLARPISELAETARVVGRGDLTRRAGVTGPPEVRTLAANFNQMVESVAGHEAELLRYAAMLEERVRERTAELEDTNRRLAGANEELACLSRSDGLTKVANRRRFDEVFADEWSRACRNGTEVSLMLIDVDAFKSYNDHYGHVAGDDCLRRVASALNSGVRRSGDLLARYGGEEFVVLLPDTNARGGALLAESLRRAVEELGVPHAHSAVGDRVTISVGIASLHPSERADREALVALADEALYRAKRTGRNRIAVSGWQGDLAVVLRAAANAAVVGAAGPLDAGDTRAVAAIGCLATLAVG